jgi:hypothetical protein
MQSAQWKNRIKSAGFTPSFTSPPPDNTDNQTVLNINGKKLFQNTISNSSSIWDYNPDELKVMLACPNKTTGHIQFDAK